LPLALAGVYSGNFWLQSKFGSEDDFFEGRYVTKKDSDDIAEFYQAEDLLRIIAIWPFFFDLFMNKVEPDVASPTEDTALLSLEETHFNVKLLGMEVSFEIIEQEGESADGEMKVVSFMRHERFIDWVPLLKDLGIDIMLWDQTWVFGFNRHKDGTVEVYHRGERFSGPWLIRLIVFFHQSYVLWACEKYINGDAFGSDDIDRQQEQLANIPRHVWRNFVARVRAEKEKTLEAQRKDPLQGGEAIAKTTAELEKLKDLSAGDPSICVAKRPIKRSVSKRGDNASSTKLVVGDAATQEALQSAMEDAKGNLAIGDAVRELVESPELQFEKRTLTRKASNRSGTATSPLSS